MVVRALVAGGALLLAVGCCASKGGATKETSMPKTPAGIVTRTVRVPTDTIGWNPWTPCEIDPQGRQLACTNLARAGAASIVVDLGVDPVVGANDSRGVADGAPLLVDADTVREIGGARNAPHGIPADDLWASSWWTAARGADGIYVHVTQATGGPRASVELFDLAAVTRRWQVGLDRLRGYPMGVGVAADGSVVAVVVRPVDGDGADTLIALDGVDGHERWRRDIALAGRLTPSPVLFAPDGRELLLVARDGDEAVLLAVAASDGHELRRVALPAAAILESPSASMTASWGYDGDAVWFHHYRPERTSDHALDLGPGHVVPAACSYELYDAHQVRPRALRTAADVPGEVGDALRTCRVLTLRSLAGRGVAVIGVPHEGTVAVSLLDGPP